MVKRRTRFQDKYEEASLPGLPPYSVNNRSWEIFKLHLAGSSYDQLAARYAVTRQNIYQIIERIDRILTEQASVCA